MTAARIRGGSSASAQHRHLGFRRRGRFDPDVGYLGAVLLPAGVRSAPLVKVGVDQHLAGVCVPGVRADSGPRHVHAEQHGLHQVLGQVSVARGEQGGGMKEASSALEDVRAELVFPGPVGHSHTPCTRWPAHRFHTPSVVAPGLQNHSVLVTG